MLLVPVEEVVVAVERWEEEECVELVELVDEPEVDRVVEPVDEVEEVEELLVVEELFVEEVVLPVVPEVVLLFVVDDVPDVDLPVEEVVLPVEEVVLLVDPVVALLEVLFVDPVVPEPEVLIVDPDDPVVVVVCFSAAATTETLFLVNPSNAIEPRMQAAKKSVLVFMAFKNVIFQENIQSACH
jgi:hypothetical protein